MRGGRARRHVNNLRKKKEGYFSSKVLSLTHYRSIAALKAANAIPPPTIAFGPDPLAKIPPARNPARTGFTISFLARYFEKREREKKEDEG